jgi:hypothetical protein
VAECDLERRAQPPPTWGLRREMRGCQNLVAFDEPDKYFWGGRSHQHLWVGSEDGVTLLGVPHEPDSAHPLVYPIHIT